MRFENYRLIFIGSIVSAFLLYIFSFKSIFLLLLLLIALCAVLNVRSVSSFQRRLLQRGLSLGLLHKSSRVSQSSSKCSTKIKSQEENKFNDVNHGSDSYNVSVLKHKKGLSFSQGRDLSKSACSNVDTPTIQPFVFNQKISASGIASQRSLRASPYSARGTRDFSDDLHLQEGKLFEHGSSYTYQPTRRVLSIARRYPIHQHGYGQLGLFPRVQLNPCPVPLLNLEGKSYHTPVTIRIAPPRVFTPSPIKLSTSPALIVAPEQPNPCDARTVVAALKENSRKRLRRDETVDYDSKRQRCDSSSNSNESQSVSSLNELHPMEEEELQPYKALSSKRPATPGPLSGPSPGLLQKRHKNNAILSSYSSTKRTAKQMSEIKAPLAKQIKTASPVKESYVQTDGPWTIFENPKADGISSKLLDKDNESGLSKQQEPEKTESPSPSGKSPFPALKEGFSPRQNISFYADIGKSSKFVYNMPSYLPTLADYQQDTEIKQQRLNNLLFGSKKNSSLKIAGKDNTESTTQDLTSVKTPFANVGDSDSTTVSTIKPSVPLQVSDNPSQFKLPPISLSATGSLMPSATILSFTSSGNSDNTEKNDVSVQQKQATENLFSNSSMQSTGFFSVAPNSNLSSDKLDSDKLTVATSLVSETPPGFLSSAKPVELSNTNIIPLPMKNSTLTSETVNNFLAKPVTSFVSVSDTQTKSVFATRTPNFADDFSKQQEKNPITTLTTATTTQTSIPTFSLFTSQSNTKGTVSLAASSMGLLPVTTLTNTDSVNNTLSESSTTSISSQPSGLPPPYSTASLHTTFTTTETSTPVKSSLNTTVTEPQSSKPETLKSPRNIFLESGGIGVHSTLSGNVVSQGNVMFSTPLPTHSTAELANTNNAFKATSETPNAFGKNMFSFTTKSTTSLPTTEQPNSSFSGSIFGMTSPVKSSQLNTTFGIPTTCSQLGFSNKPVNSTAATSSSGLPLSMGPFGTPQNSVGAFNTPNPNTTFGQFSPASNSFNTTKPKGSLFGQPSQPANVFGTTMNQPGAFGQATSFGATSQPASVFGSGNQAFGSLATGQASSFGSVMPEKTLTQVTTSQTVFTPVSETKTIFSVPTPTFGNSATNFNSPFGNANTNSLGTFNNPNGQQESVADGNKGPSLVGSGASVFGSTVAPSSDTPSFNSTSTSTMNFNFNSKPNFNFGSGTGGNNFGTVTTSQPFVFSGVGTPGSSTGNTLSTPNNFFSIGASNRERRPVTRKRFGKK